VVRVPAIFLARTAAAALRRPFPSSLFFINLLRPFCLECWSWTCCSFFGILSDTVDAGRSQTGDPVSPPFWLSGCRGRRGVRTGPSASLTPGGRTAGFFFQETKGTGVGSFFLTFFLSGNPWAISPFLLWQFFSFSSPWRISKLQTVSFFWCLVHSPRVNGRFFFFPVLERGEFLLLEFLFGASVSTPLMGKKAEPGSPRYPRGEKQ